MSKKIARISRGQLAAGALLCAGVFCQSSAAQTASAAPSADAAPAAALAGLKYNHVSLSVQDLDREVEWYERVLGFKETKRLNRPSMINVNLSNGNMRIDIIKYTGSKRTPADPVYMEQGWAHLALTVPDIPAALAALKAANADAKGGNNTIVLRDPEGNEMEIFLEGSPLAATGLTAAAPAAGQK